MHGVLWGTADLQKEWVEKEPGAPGERTFVGFQRNVGRVVGRKQGQGCALIGEFWKLPISGFKTANGLIGCVLEPLLIGY